MPASVAKGKAQGKVSTPPKAERRTEATPVSVSLPALRVRYFRQMKPARVHAFEVSWQKSERPVRGDGKQVTVRLLAAGAQVLPSEQTLDAAKPEKTVTFYVTPLARGWLRHVRLEVLYEGRKVQEIPMASKVASQRPTWALLFLALLVPYLLQTYVKHTPLEENDLLKGGVQEELKMQHALEDMMKDNLPQLGPDVDNAIGGVRTSVAQTYVGLVKLSKQEPVSFYASSGLVGLALLSAWLCAAKRRYAVGKPITLKRADGED